MRKHWNTYVSIDTKANNLWHVVDATNTEKVIYSGGEAECVAMSWGLNNLHKKDIYLGDPTTRAEEIAYDKNNEWKNTCQLLYSQARNHTDTLFVDAQHDCIKMRTER